MLAGAWAAGAGVAGGAVGAVAGVLVGVIALAWVPITAILGLLITAAAGWLVQRDNARRQIAEEALQESERKYRMLIQGIKDYAIYMLGPQGEIRTWNPGAERLLGYSESEIAGKDYARFFTPG